PGLADTAKGGRACLRNLLLWGLPRFSRVNTVPLVFTASPGRTAMFRRRFPALLAFVAAATVLLLSAGARAADKDFFVKDGDTIAEQHLYSNYVEMWVVSRFPKWKLTFRNVGIGGDRSTGGNNRFKRDVLAHKATAMTVDFGMNDGNYQPFKEGAFNTYTKG